MRLRYSIPAIRTASILLAGCLAACKSVEPLRTDQVQRALEIVWNNPGNTRALCAAAGRLTYPAVQTGIQGLEQRFVLGQWAIRVTLPAGDRDVAQLQDIRRLEYLAKVQMLTRSDSRINVGPIAGIPAVEYRLTLKGWVNSIAPPGATPCLYFGTRQLFGMKDFVESEKDKDGNSTVKINLVAGVKETAEWARDEEASSLFPEIKRELEGQVGTMTLYRDKEGRLLRTPGAKDRIINIDDKTRHLPSTTPSVPPSEAELRAAIEKVPILPIKQSEQAVPAPCLRLSPRYGPQIWNQNHDIAGRNAVLLLDEKASGTTLAHKRLLDLAKAGLATLKEVRAAAGGATRSLNAELNVPNDGGCIPLGKTQLEVHPVRSEFNFPNRTRFKARYIVIEPAPWVRQLKNPQFLPDLAAILQDGLPFEGDATRGADGWTISGVTDGYPSITMPALSSVGTSPGWYVDPIGFGDGLFLASDHELHVVSADVSSRQEVARGRESSSLPVVNIYVNPTSRPAILLLQAYDSVDWRIHQVPGAQLAAILAIGYHPQRVSGSVGKAITVTVNPFDGRSRIDGSATYPGTFQHSGNGLLRLIGVTPSSANETTGARPIIIGQEFDPSKTKRRK